MSQWRYDGSIDRFPLKPGELWTCQHGSLMVNDLYDGLPAFMRAADCVFVDPPWNAGNENSFRTKAGLAHNPAGFTRFLDMLFSRLDAIAPETCFVEIGKQNVAMVEERLAARFAHLTRYPSTYYRKHPCFVVRAAQTPPAIDYSDLDEADIIARICAEEPFSMIADPCMGRGLVGFNAFRRQRQFRGTELNPARLAVLVNKIHAIGGEWYVDGARFEPQPGQPGAVGSDRKGLR